MADPDIAHADIAGWVPGALDPDESERFQASSSADFHPDPPGGASRVRVPASR